MRESHGPEIHWPAQCRSENANARQLLRRISAFGNAGPEPLEHGAAELHATDEIATPPTHTRSRGNCSTPPASPLGPARSPSDYCFQNYLRV